MALNVVVGVGIKAFTEAEVVLLVGVRVVLTADAARTVEATPLVGEVEVTATAEVTLLLVGAVAVIEVVGTVVTLVGGTDCVAEAVIVREATVGVTEFVGNVAAGAAAAVVRVAVEVTAVGIVGSCGA